MKTLTWAKAKQPQVNVRGADEQFARELELVRRATRGENLKRFEIHLRTARGELRAVEHYNSLDLAVRSGQSWERRALGNWFALHELNSSTRFCQECEQWQPVHAGGNSFILICDECGATIDDSLPA